MGANNQTPHFYTNIIETPGHWSTLVLEGTTSNRDAIGAKVAMGVDGQVIYRHVKAGSGFAAQCQRALHFGIGDAQSIEFIEVTWPSGNVTRIQGTDLPENHVNRTLRIREGSTGIALLPPLEPSPNHSGSP